MDKEMVHSGNTIQDYMALVKACTKRKDICKAMRLHEDIMNRSLLAKSPYLASSLINMYAKFGMLDKARQVLDEIPTRKVVCWNALISGYSQEEEEVYEAFDGLNRMRHEGLSPTGITYTSILNACGKTNAICKGKQIHGEILESGLLVDDVILGTALVDMYAKCGDLPFAQQVLKELHIRDVISWSALINGYVRQGQGKEALCCFEEMQSENLSPDAIVLTSILKACGSIGAIDKGRHIHEHIVRLDLLADDLILGNALVDMYVKLSMLQKAGQVLAELPLRNVVSWSTLIAGYAQHGRGQEGLDCFLQMQSEGHYPNPVTFVCILNACGNMGEINKGKQVHSEILSRGLLEHNIVLTTALVDMYAKCGFLAQARAVLEEHAIRHTPAWNVIVGAYAQQGQNADAFDCFEQMHAEGLAPDSITYICMLKACGNSGAIDKGKLIHEQITSKGLLATDTAVGTSLIDMYAKCGMFTKAQHVLDELPARNVVSWNALMSGFAQEMKAREALNSFVCMQYEGLVPDEITFQCVLEACCHSGRLDEAHTFLRNVSKKQKFTPTLQHLTSMVTAFGCAGYFDKAMSVINVMPSGANSAGWIALLDACKFWANLKLGLLAFDQLLQLDNHSAIAYALIADILLSAGMQDDAKKVKMMSPEYAAFKMERMMEKP